MTHEKAFSILKGESKVAPLIILIMPILSSAMLYGMSINIIKIAVYINTALMIAAGVIAITMLRVGIDIEPEVTKLIFTDDLSNIQKMGVARAFVRNYGRNSVLYAIGIVVNLVFIYNTNNIGVTKENAFILEMLAQGSLIYMITNLCYSLLRLTEFTNPYRQYVLKKEG